MVAWKFFEGPGNLTFRLVGANMQLQRAYMTRLKFLLIFDFMVYPNSPTKAGLIYRKSSIKPPSPTSPLSLNSPLGRKKFMVVV